jgi:hypothetical protein
VRLKFLVNLGLRDFGRQAIADALIRGSPLPNELIRGLGLLHHHLHTGTVTDLSAQNAHGFAAFHVPEPHGFIIRSWNKITTVVGEDHIADLRLVSSSVNLQDRFFDGVEQGQQEQEDEQGRKSLRKIFIFFMVPSCN